MVDETSDRFALPLLVTGQAQKEITHNEALILIDMLLHARVESRSLSIPPEMAQPGACWIVAADGAGAWMGQDGCLAMMTSGGWRFLAPRAGMRVEVADEDMNCRHDGVAWVLDALRPDGVYLEGLKIIGARAAPVADPLGGSVVDSEARGVLTQLLAALRSHGLIEVI